MAAPQRNHRNGQPPSPTRRPVQAVPAEPDNDNLDSLSEFILSLPRETLARLMAEQAQAAQQNTDNNQVPAGMSRTTDSEKPEVAPPLLDRFLERFSDKQLRLTVVSVLGVCALVIMGFAIAMQSTFGWILFFGLFIVAVVACTKLWPPAEHPQSNDQQEGSDSNG